MTLVDSVLLSSPFSSCTQSGNLFRFGSEPQKVGRCPRLGCTLSSQFVWGVNSAVIRPEVKSPFNIFRSTRIHLRLGILRQLDVLVILSWRESESERVKERESEGGSTLRAALHGAKVPTHPKP